MVTLVIALLNISVSGARDAAVGPGWAWDYAESAGRLCGGDYTCEINEYCKGPPSYYCHY